MAYEYKLLGQDIFVGTTYADLYWSDQCIGFEYVPSMFDGIKYFLNKYGTMPAAGTTDYFYNANNVKVFAMRVSDVGGGLRKIEYAFPYWDNYSYTWNDNFQGANWSDYTGFDPAHITDEDHKRNGVWFWFEYYDLYYGSTPPNPYGCSFGFYDIDNITPVFDPESVICEYDEDLTPPRYIYNGGMMYATSPGGAQMSLIYPGIKQIFDELAEEVNTFLDDTAEPGGIVGSYEFHSDPVDFPEEFELSIQDLGIATMWHPTKQQMKDFTDFLWSSSFVDNILKLIADPLENVIQIGAVPIDVTTLDGTAKEVKVGNVGTGVSMNPLTNQRIFVDLGTISIPAAWGTVMDCNPFTRLSILLPFVGVFDLDTDEVINGKIQIGYWVDLLTGDFTAFVKIKNNQSKNVLLNSVMYEKTGNMMINFPLTGANYGQMYKTVVSGLVGAGSNAISGNIGGALENMADSAIGAFTTPLQRTGSYSGASAVMGIFEAYVILSQPLQHLDKHYSEYEGFPSYLSFALKDLHGYTKVEALKDNTVGATEWEKAEIERLLKEGVFLP